MRTKIAAAWRRLRYWMLGVAYDVLALPREAELEIRTADPVRIRFELGARGPRFHLSAGFEEAFAIAELEDRFPRRSFVVFRRDTSADRWRHAFSIDSEGRIRRPTPADASSGRTRREAAG